MLNIDVLCESINKDRIKIDNVFKYFRQLLALYSKAIRINNVLQEEIYTYDFDLAHQTVIEYDLLITGIKSYVYDYSFPIPDLTEYIELKY